MQLRDRVLTWLENSVPRERVQHILGVEAMCADLARHHGYSVETARLAGLTHDLAKFFDPRDLLVRATAAGLEVDAICAERPHLLHADVSALVARDEFGITEPQVLDAIANHTFGRPEMGPICCIVFAADKLEPHRGDTPELDNMRRTCFANLYRGVRYVCDYSLKYLVKTSRPIHPRSVATRNWALKRERA
ncbi:putative HD superfamily hydrolase of NAD metabolism [Rubidibacter lacunae KORDI 51-2]|uniref:bis(5'-nucleosyl)-tetraphosphatase (symmetrical) n=1 Tax=Rubidibacter lacunae KORDI 51-2 TaxID=582515 RepID=U5DD22_9CHRO|nr:bis(5'-nucleosyl)-tetraphosphatase (symmetrical) YqeK [Rubidibacter lacunae]ERN42418.1 putative HD superfamily hydrolase of NAD metabolism [Rubidibacter lacunae KORDI 51-2]